MKPNQTNQRRCPSLVTETNVDDVLRRMRLVKLNIAGNEDFLKALRGHWTVAHPTEKREYNPTGLLQSSLTSLPDHRRPTADRPKKPGSRQISAVNGQWSVVWGKRMALFQSLRRLCNSPDNPTVIIGL